MGRHCPETYEDPAESFTDADGAFHPSPQYIRERCEEIRRGWSPKERQERMRWAVDRARFEWPTAAWPKLDGD